MFIVVNSITIKIHSKAFHASLELWQLQGYSVNPSWQRSDLRLTRITDPQRGEVRVFLHWQPQHAFWESGELGRSFLRSPKGLTERSTSEFSEVVVYEEVLIGSPSETYTVVFTSAPAGAGGAEPVLLPHLHRGALFWGKEMREVPSSLAKPLILAVVAFGAGLCSSVPGISLPLIPHQFHIC